MDAQPKDREVYFNTEHGAMRDIFKGEGAKCQNGHLFLTKFIRESLSGEKMCPHCDSTDVLATRLFTDEGVPLDVEEFFKNKQEALE